MYFMCSVCPEIEVSVSSTFNYLGYGEFTDDPVMIFKKNACLQLSFD